MVARGQHDWRRVWVPHRWIRIHCGVFVVKVVVVVVVKVVELGLGDIGMGLVLGRLRIVAVLGKTWRLLLLGAEKNVGKS